MLLIEPLLRTMPNLKELLLYSNNIGDEGCRTIAPALRTMTNLKWLYLSFNNIGDEGLAVLTNVVSAIPMLYDLALSDNKIGNVGCQCLLELIENDSLQSLTSLWLNRNPNISSELKTKVKRVWREKGKHLIKLDF
jgi:Ran GTPase-activating protein (RanGAP) involved in mRNA processing and transport